MDDPDDAAPPDAQRRLVETTERQCPACKSRLVAPIGQITAVFGVIKSQHQCEACEHRFVFVRTSLLDP
jgi:C4-type Zn-finger protein